MTEPLHLRETRTSYDTVAEPYASFSRDSFAAIPIARSMLTAFAELVQSGGGGPVADLGCGPGHVTALLHDLGLATFGLDLSPGMVEVARRDHPGLHFEVGSMTDLNLADGELAGAVAWWSIIHTPPEVLPVVLAELHRVLAPGGHLLLGFHVGDERRRKETGYGGHPMGLDLFLLPPDRVIELATVAGLGLVARLLLEPAQPAGTPQACLILHRPLPD